MFSPDIWESSRIVEITFIAGVQFSCLKSSVKSILKFENVFLKPEILFSFPDNTGIITNPVLDFVFPNKINVSYIEQKPKFYSIVLTNEKGIRTHCYILRLYEKINIDDLLKNEDNVINNFTSKSFKTSSSNELISNLDDKLKQSLLNENQERETKLTDCSSKSIWVPYAICIWSTGTKVEFFKQLMKEIHQIIKYTNYSFTNEEIMTYRYLEILNLLIFVSNIVKPPSYTKMNVNLRFSNLEYLTSSRYEIPYSEQNIKVLFDTLEISAIIKLWCSILSEKHIIIIANQYILLYSIAEALLNLIFPFKWLHTYIPVLPHDQMDYLESPTPYIMGVISSYTDIEYLTQSFPNHIICDVNTSIVYGTSFCKLPLREESNLRKKIQYARNTHSNNLEDLETESYSENIMMNIEDVLNTRTFSENVQYIFFRIFRNSLNGLKTKYINKGVFESQKFLDNFSDPDLREFWEKIINTAAFEYFILNFQLLDDSNTSIFRNIFSTSEEKLESIYSKSEIFTFQLNFPTSIEIIFDQIQQYNYHNINCEKKFTEFSKIYHKVINVINSENEKIIRNNQLPAGRNFLQSINSLKSSIKKNKLENYATFKNNRRMNNLSSDFVNFKPNKLEEKNSIGANAECGSNNFKQFRRQSSTYEVRKLFGGAYTQLQLPQINSIVNSPSSFIHTPKPTITKNKITDFSIYGENGFIEFALKLIKPDSNSYIEFLNCELGYHNEMLKIIQKFNNNDHQANDFSNIQETESENENEYDYFSANSLRNSIKYDFTEILEINKKETFQFYLLLAFYLDDYASSNEGIFELYKHALLKDKLSFPKTRFFQFLLSLPIDDLKSLTNIKELQNDAKIKMIKKILNLSIHNLENKKVKIHSSANNLNAQKKRVNRKTSRKMSSLKNFFDTKNETQKLAGSNEKQTSGIHLQENSIDSSASDSDSREGEKLKKVNKRKITVQNLLNINRKSSVNVGMNSDTKSRASFCGDIFDNRADANKIIESLKTIDSKENRIVKKSPLNTFSSLQLNTENLDFNFNIQEINQLNVDPIALAEDLAVRIMSLILKNSLNKFKSEMFTPNLFGSICDSLEFYEIKLLTYKLQFSNLNTLFNDTLKTCFWLNIYNSLIIFTLIFKKIVLTDFYEWYCFFKNYIFNIGGYEFSLYEIENCILKSNIICTNNYGGIPFISNEDPRKSLIIGNTPKDLRFGISIPTSSGPAFRVYFPNNLENLLRLNGIDLFWKNIKVDVENSLICIPEYVNWIDDNFVENILKYKE